MCAYIEKSVDTIIMQNRKQEAHDIIQAYQGLGLHKASNVPNPKDICKTEVIMILTDEAVTYYRKNNKKGEIDKKIQEKCNNQKCMIYEWENEKMKLIKSFN